MKQLSTSFYIVPKDIKRGRVSFSREESNHIARVMRASVDDEVRAVDGIGHAYRIRLTRVDPAHSRGEIIEPVEPAPEPNIHFTMGIGTILPKRLEAAWDSCVQLGISELIPIRTAYSTKRLREDGRYIERLRTVGRRAMLQCGRAILPEVGDPVDLSRLLTGGHDIVLYGDIDGLPTPPARRPELGANVLLLIGPEGGFSSEEDRLIQNAGGIGISLGPRKLRAETAAVTLAVIALRWTADI